MPTTKVEQLPKNTVKLTITLGVEELKPFLEAAAEHLSEHTDIPGFRPGKAGYDIVKNRFGEMKIYEEALEPIVRKTLYAAIVGNDLETIGSPKIDVTTMAPGNDLVYTAELAKMPAVTKLADYKKISVKAEAKPVENKDIETVLKDLTHMQTREARAAAGSAAAGTDKVVLSVNMKKAGVPVEGGQAPSHAVFLGEEYYIPGFKEHVSGMKEGESKTFAIKFPDEHASKMLAGSDIDFDITVKEIFNLVAPEINDEFAKSLGQKDVAELKTRITDNLKAERAQEEQARQERDILEKIAADSRFDDIPDLLVNEEINKMLAELESNVAEQGMDFEKYLSSLKKTVAQLKMEFSPQAIVRIKVALIVREVAKQENISVSDKEVDDELDKIAAEYEDAEAKKRVYAPQSRDYVQTILRNRKVIDLLRAAIVK
jgi:trigger factor